MKFREIYSNTPCALSLEFFPPKTESLLPDTEQLIKELGSCNPSFMTVTYGAGGGTRNLTRKLVSYIQQQMKVTAVAHLTCVGHSLIEIDSTLDNLKEEGVNNVLALRGDPPKGDNEFKSHPEGFANARDLARHIRTRGDFSVAVAGYPEVHKDALSADSDLDYLKQKADSGAEVIITQLFFDNALYYRFRDKAQSAGISLPIVPGIMPVGNYSQVKRFTEMCGASIPAKMLSKLQSLEHDTEALVSYGTNYAIEQCRELVKNGVPGIHLYTLNKTSQVKPIIESLALTA